MAFGRGRMNCYSAVFCSPTSWRSARSSLPMVSARTSNTRCFTPSFSYSGADGALHQHERALGQRARELSERPEQDHPVPFRAALPGTVRVLPGFFGGHRQRGDERCVLRVMNFGVLSGEAD